MDPEQSVFLFGMGAIDFDFGGQKQLALKRTVINFQGKHLQGARFFARGFGRLTRTSQDDATRLDLQIDGGFFDAGKIDANADAGFATKGVDGRLPRFRRTLPELHLGDGDLAVQPSHFEGIHC